METKKDDNGYSYLLQYLKEHGFKETIKWTFLPGFFYVSDCNRYKIFILHIKDKERFELQVDGRRAIGVEPFFFIEAAKNSAEKIKAELKVRSN